MDDLVNLVTLADGSKIILQDEDDITLSLVSNSKWNVEGRNAMGGSVKKFVS